MPRSAHFRFVRSDSLTATAGTADDPPDTAFRGHLLRRVLCGLLLGAAATGLTSSSRADTAFSNYMASNASDLSNFYVAETGCVGVASDDVEYAMKFTVPAGADYAFTRIDLTLKLIGCVSSGTVVELHDNAGTVPGSTIYE